MVCYIGHNAKGVAFLLLILVYRQTGRYIRNLLIRISFKYGNIRQAEAAR